MKKFRTGILILAAMGSLAFHSCKEENREPEVETVEAEEGQHDPAHTEEDAATAAEVEVIFDNASLSTVFERYIEVKDALVATNAAEARDAADQLRNTLGKIDATDAAKQATEKIANSEDINEQREAFTTLSAEMETLIDGNIRSGNVYKQYCPMAFEGQGGYWLSNRQEIRNPYYGDKMLKCGSVEKTFE